MVKHREHIPLILALSLGIGLMPDLYHALTYSRATSLVPVLSSGSLIGSLLAYAVIIWIKRYQLNGVLYLGVGATLVLLAYLAVVYVFAWPSLVTAGSAFCSIMLPSDAIDCGYKVFVLRSVTDFALCAGIYIGGIRLEGRSSQRLIYKFRF